jgi:hypothetical protein
MATITELKPNEVFVFGSNLGAFHGAGAAGYAQMGTSKNEWRTNPEFQLAYAALKQKNGDRIHNPKDLVGKWSILGSNGLMQGREGKSYGLITTEAPGKQGCVNDAFLLKEIQKLFICAKEHPELTFLCSNFGLKRPEGFSWWSKEEITALWKKAGDMPTNIVPPSYMTSLQKEAHKKTNGPQIGSLD